MGILNGIDDTEWDPTTDPHIARPYGPDTIDDKEWNKKALLEALGLPYRRHIPVVGIVSRLAWQKGLELIFEALPHFLHRARCRKCGKASKISSSPFCHASRLTMPTTGIWRRYGSPKASRSAFLFHSLSSMVSGP